MGQKNNGPEKFATDTLLFREIDKRDRKRGLVKCFVLKGQRKGRDRGAEGKEEGGKEEHLGGKKKGGENLVEKKKNEDSKKKKNKNNLGQNRHY